MTMHARRGHADRPIEITADNRVLNGILCVPPGASAVVLFAHGSGSGRLSPRNQSVAAVLQSAGIATLLFDLLDEEESAERVKVFDIELLARRLQIAAEWTDTQRALRGFRLCYFGASTGAAAALLAAAHQRKPVAAIVCRGGRPDLAMNVLPKVQAPTLLIVGSNDDTVLELNREALTRLSCAKELAVIPGASHLFAEPGALEQVADLTAKWFQKHLTSGVG